MTPAEKEVSILFVAIVLAAKILGKREIFLYGFVETLPGSGIYGFPDGLLHASASAETVLTTSEEILQKLGLSLSSQKPSLIWFDRRRIAGRGVVVYFRVRPSLFDRHTAFTPLVPSVAEDAQRSPLAEEVLATISAWRTLKRAKATIEKARRLML